MKEAKKPQPITKKSPKSKSKPTPAKESDSDVIYAWREVPISERTVEKWAEELEKWVQLNPDAKTITEYIYSKGISTGAYTVLRRKHSILNDAHEKAMRRLGERLWAAAIDRKADWAPVRFMLHAYGSEFDDAKRYEAALKEKIAAAGGIRVVEIPAFEDKK